MTDAKANINAEPGHDVDLYGWDTVFVVDLDVLNAAIAKAEASPRGFQAELKKDGYSVTGSFGDWRIAPGGSGELVRMYLPMHNCVLLGPGINEPPFSAIATIQLRLAFVDHPGGNTGKSDLVIDHTPGTPDNPLTVLIDVTYAATPLAFIPDAAFRALLKDWLQAHLAEFDHVFSTVDISRKAAHQQFQWMQPTTRAYAYCDTVDVQGGGGALGVLCMTGNRKPQGAVRQLSPFVLPKGNQAVLAISGGRLLEELLLPCLPRVFRGTTTSDFLVRTDSSEIVLAKAPTRFAAVDPKTGDKHDAEIRDFRLSLIGAEIRFAATTAAEAKLGINAVCAQTSVLTLYEKPAAAGAAGPSFDFAKKSSDVRHWTETTEGLKIAEDIAMGAAAVFTAIGVVTGGVGFLVDALIAGLIYGGLELYENDAEQSDADAAPNLSLTALDATGAITWTGQEAFAVQHVALNRALQLIGSL